MTIKDLRLKNNLSQKEFGDLIGVTQAAVYKWENKDIKLSKSNQDKIDKIFVLKRKNNIRATSQNLGV